MQQHFKMVCRHLGPSVHASRFHKGSVVHIKDENLTMFRLLSDFYWSFSEFLTPN